MYCSTTWITCSRMTSPIEVVQGGLMHPPWRWSGSSGIGFDSQSVVHGNPELLLASKIALRCLDGDVSKQELDLITPMRRTRLTRRMPAANSGRRDRRRRPRTRCGEPRPAED